MNIRGETLYVTILMAPQNEKKRKIDVCSKPEIDARSKVMLHSDIRLIFLLLVATNIINILYGHCFLIMLYI